MGQMEQGTARTNSLRLKLAPDMTERLEKLAVTYGMPLSTLGAFAVADWVARQEMNASMTRMAVLEATRQGTKSIMSESAMEAAFERVLPQILVEMARAGLGVPEGVQHLHQGPDASSAGSGSSAGPEAAAPAESAGGASPGDRARTAT